LPELGNSLLVSLGRIAGIGGIGLGVFLLLFRNFLEQHFISNLQLQAEQGYRLLLLFVLFTFGMAIAGLAVWAGHQVRGRQTSIYLLLFALALAVLGSWLIIADSRVTPPRQPSTESPAPRASGPGLDAGSHQLESDGHPFRFTYLRIGSAEDLLSFLGGDTLAKEPVAKTFTVHNQVYDSLCRIRDRYLDRDVAVDCRANNYTSCVPRRTTLMALLLGFGYDRLLNDLSGSGYTQLVGYHYKPDAEDYEYSSSLLGLPNYSLVSSYADAGAQELAKEPDAKNEIKVFTQYTDQLSYNLQKANPEDRDLFFVYSEFTNRNICDETETYEGVQRPSEGHYARVVLPGTETMGTFILSRTPEFTLLDVENVSTLNVTIDKVAFAGFDLPEGDFLQIRDDHQQQERLNTSPRRFVEVPFQVLKPGEHLMFPLDTSLGEHIGEADMLFTLGDLKRKQESTYASLPDPVSIHFIWPMFEDDLREKTTPWYRPGIDTRDEVSKTEDGIPMYLIQSRYPKALILSKPRLRELARDRLYFGPAIKPLSVLFHGVGQDKTSDVEEPIRSPDFKENIGLVTYAVGTCPKVYTYDPSVGALVFDTKIIVNNRSRASEAWEVAPLHRFNGRILLSEEDEEVAYLDVMQAIVIYEDGHREVLRPRDVRLQENDRRYVVLRRGQTMEIVFDPPSVGSVRGVFLRTLGYFDAKDPLGTGDK
jgi:hypothetical protein